MLSRSRTRSTTRWPFWLLIVAWVCANSPQAATYAVLSWIGEARSFSHQQRLAVDVARVLTGAHDDEVPAVELSRAGPERPFAPQVPPEATLKKIQLAMETGTEVGPPRAGAMAWKWGAVRLPADRLAAPPYEPPRSRGLS